jgi:hypothetical protein
MAENATLWLYREIGLHEGKVPPPGWIPPDSTGLELQALFAEKFQLDVERTPRDPRFENVDDACRAWARRKHGDRPGVDRLAQRLQGIAHSILFETGAFGAVPTIVAAHAILKSRQLARPRVAALPELKALLTEFKISPRLCESVLREAGQGYADPVSDLLTRFFSVRDRRWARFLNKHGQVRTRKLPNVPDATEALVAAFRNPEMPGSDRDSHLGYCLNARDADDLAGLVLKAAFPQHVRGAGGASVKQKRLYHKRLRKRPPVQRPRYGRT